MAPKRKSGKSEAKPAKKGKLEEKVNGADETFASEAKTKDGKLWNLKIVSWNVDGLRAWIKKDGLSILKKEDPDIICFQEIKCSEAKLPPEFTQVEGYTQTVFPAVKEGYAGVALLSKVKPLTVSTGIEDEVHDAEGRLITAEFDHFFVVTAYVPNSGRKLVTLDKRMDWDTKLLAHLKALDAKKAVVYCGDLNVAHHEIDLANPKSNRRNAGFTQEERDGFSHLHQEGDLIDSFRTLYPDLKDQYTFWSYMTNARSRNIGWRLDYFVLSSRLAPALCDNLIRKDVLGSDHCPITLLMQF